MEKRIRLTTRLAADKKDKDKEKSKKGETHRDIPKDLEYDKSKVKHIKKILHNINVSIGNLTGAAKEFSTIKGPDISPDGMLGGRGYIKTIREIKNVLSETVHDLADLADTLVDELNNPKWELQEKEQKELKEEETEIEEKAEEIDEALEEPKPEEEETSEEETTEPEEEPEEEEPEPEEEESGTSEEPYIPEEETPESESEIDTLLKESNEISTADVQDSSEVLQERESKAMQESMDRYLSALEEDTTKVVLSKKILANLVRKV